MKIIEELPFWATDLDHYDNRMQFHCVGEREAELDDWLYQSGALYRKSFITEDSYPGLSVKSETGIFSTIKEGNTVVSIHSLDDMMRFKLSWIECEPTNVLKKVILPVIRRVMPTVIANQIIGVQPMTTTAPLHLSKLLNSRYCTTQEETDESSDTSA